MQYEKEAKLKLLSQLEEDIDSVSTVNRIQQKPCKKCTILEEETKKMLDSIRTLESVIKVLDKENTAKKDKLSHNMSHQSLCLHCFPPLGIPSSQQISPSANKRQRLPTSGLASNSLTNNMSDSQEDSCVKNNECRSSYENSHEDHLLSRAVNSTNNVFDMKQKPGTSSRKFTPRSSLPSRAQPLKLVILADSHGKYLSNLVHQRSTADVCAYVRSGAKFNKVTEEVKQLSRDLSKEDFLLVIAGTNNVESTGVRRLMEDVSCLIQNSTHTNLLLATLPMRHDQPHLDSKISHINSEIEKLAKNNQIELLPLHLFPRHLYTNHGMHLNKKGKAKVADMVTKLLARTTNTKPTSTSVAENNSNQKKRALEKSIDQWTTTTTFTEQAMPAVSTSHQEPTPPSIPSSDHHTQATTPTSPQVQHQQIPKSQQVQQPSSTPTLSSTQQKNLMTNQIVNVT